MSSLALDFFRYGPKAPSVEGLQYSRYPNFVLPNLRERSPIFSDAETLLTSVQKDSLQERVYPVKDKPHQFVVDKFFLIVAQSTAPQEEALRLWSDLRLSCQKMGIAAGCGAASLTLLALWGAPIYIEVALFAGIIAACYFAGRCLQRYLIAEKELAVWQQCPGEDFALRRKASLELTLDKISKQKCHYHLEQPGGTLLGVEILFIFRQNLKRFAEPLLARECTKPEEQHQWVADFLTSNPMMIDFFHENPHLLSEKKWEDVVKFQLQIVSLMNLLKNLRDLFVPQFTKLEQKTKEFQKSLIESSLASAVDVCQKLALDSQTTKLYQQRLLQALNEEFLSKASAVVEQFRVKTTYFCSLVYPQVRNLLEQASKGLLEEQACELDPAVFANMKSVIPNFQQEFDVITQNYPQNMIYKAKSLSQDASYQKFVDEVFKP